MAFSRDRPACDASASANSSERSSNGTTSVSKSSGLASLRAGTRFLLMSWMTPMTTFSAESMGTVSIERAR